MNKLIWARREPFNPLSRDQTLAYCVAMKYPIPKDRKTKRPTVNDEALEKLSLRFPEDKILSGVRRNRAISKARGYLKGTYLGRDDRFHPQYINLPETGRLSSKAPNIQNQPQGRDQAKAELAKEVRNTVVASPGFKLGETDWRAIEALLVGYFGGDPAYMRLARLGVHDFLSCRVVAKQPVEWSLSKEIGPRPVLEDFGAPVLFEAALEEWERDRAILVSAIEEFKQEPPILEMSDEQLKGKFKKLKKLFPSVRFMCKIVIHGCFTGDHEILTPDGWVRADAWDGQKLAVWRKDGTLSFEAPLQYHVYDHEEPLLELNGTSVKALVTKDHKFPFRTDASGKVTWRSGPISEMPKGCRLPLTGVLSNKAPLHPRDVDIQLAVALQADGHIAGSGAVRFHLRKVRKIERMESLLKGGAFEYSRADYNSKSGVSTVFSVPPGGFVGPQALLTGGKEKIFNLPLLLQLPQEKRLLFLKEVQQWDGGHQRYRTKTRVNAEAVQTLAHISGKEALLRIKKDPVEGSREDCTVQLNEREYAWMGSVEVKEVPFSGKVYCFSVTSRHFLVKYKDHIFVSGNSNYLMGVPSIARELECSVREAESLVGLYRDALPGIKTYQTQTLLLAHNERKLSCPFGCPSPYWFQVGEPLPSGEWKLGKQANEAAAWRPQHTCSCLLREVLVTLDQWDGDDFHLLAPVHDSIFWEAREEKFSFYQGVVQEVMEREWPELGGLSIETETKSGFRWSQMK